MNFNKFSSFHPFFVPPECVLLHHPLHRPSIDQILRCDWLQNRSKKSLANSTSLEEAKSIIQKRKKASFWCPKSRRTSPLSPTKSLDKPPEPIDCYTKKYNNVPVDKFKNPLEQESSLSSAKTLIPIHNHSSTFKRNNSLINSSKIVVKNHKNENLKIVQNNDIIQVRSYSNDNLEEMSTESDKDFDRFMMIPTRTSCNEDLLRALNPLEKEVRKIMYAYGIGDEAIEKHIDHGPRSEIIGIYRILLMRLKSQKEQAAITNSSQVLDNSHSMKNNSSRISNGKNHKSQRKKGSNFCAIL